MPDPKSNSSPQLIPFLGGGGPVTELGFLETLLHNAPVGIAVLGGANLRFEVVNQAFQQLRPDFSFRGHTYAEAFPAGVGARVEGLLRRVLQTGEALEETSLPFPVPGKPDAVWDHRITPFLTAGGPPAVLVMAWDVTERDRAERALRESEVRFRSVFEQTSGGIAQTDLTGRFVLVNDRFCEMVGWSREQLLDLRMQDITHADDLAENERLFVGLIEERHRRFTIEKRYLRPDGSCVWVQNSVAAVLDQEGRAQYVTAAVTEITDRKQMEETLRGSHDTFRQLVEGSPFGIYAVDRDLRLVQASRGTKKVFKNITPLIGRDLSEVLHILWPAPFAREAVERFRHTLETGEPYHSSSMVERRQDIDEIEAYDWKIERVALPDGGPGVVCHFYDLSERRKYEQALRESEQRFKVMADTAPAMLWITDEEHRCTFLSAGWLQFTGQTTEEGCGFGWLDAVHPDDRARATAIFLEAARDRQPFSFDYRLRTTSGEYRWAIDAARPRFGPSGEFLGYIGSVIDVHERKLAEEALRDADRRKDEFLATLGHELRNPLAPIRTAAHLLSLAGPRDEILVQAHGIIDRQIQHMVRLIDDLLDVSRITRGKLQLRRERVLLTSVVESAIESTRSLIESNRHELTVRLPATPVHLDCDSVRMTQVLLNLLSNAAKYTEPGGRIELSAEATEHQVIIAVKDSGVGIDSEALPRVFELFSQVQTSLERSEGGLGIGLALAKGLVEMHGGTIEAMSCGIGQGSVFVVKLPLASAPVNGGNGEEGPRVADLTIATRRIVVVDDNRDNAQMLELLLQVKGHEVRMAYDGVEALETILEFAPDVVLLDIGMPRMNGYEVARHVRSQSQDRRPTLIAMTGWGQDEDKRRALEAGFDLHLTKPVDVVVLDQLLAHLSGSARS